MLDDPVVVRSAAALFAVPTRTIPRRPGAQYQDQTARNQGSVMDTTLHQEADKAQGFMVRFHYVSTLDVALLGEFGRQGE